MPPKILVISGPTASGKTKLAVALAKARGGEVVSADSMQIYRRMDIGTAKPTHEEMEGVPHHMLDVAEPEENFSVARYVDMAARCVGGPSPTLTRTAPSVPNWRSGSGGRGARPCWTSWPGRTRIPPPASTPTMRSGSSVPWRSICPRERPSPSTTGRPSPCPPAMTP